MQESRIQNAKGVPTRSEELVRPWIRHESEPPLDWIQKMHSLIGANHHRSATNHRERCHGGCQVVGSNRRAAFVIG